MSGNVAGTTTSCCRLCHAVFAWKFQNVRQAATAKACIFSTRFLLCFQFLGTRDTSKYAIWFICAPFNSHPIFLTQQIDASICLYGLQLPEHACVCVCVFVYLFNRLSQSKSLGKCSRIALHAQWERNGTRHRHNPSWTKMERDQKEKKKKNKRINK